LISIEVKTLISGSVFGVVPNDQNNGILPC